MTQAEARLRPLAVGPDENRADEVLNVVGEPGLTKLAGTDTDGAVAVVRFTVPHLSGPPLHRHSREDEWFYVLDGEITFEIDGQRYTGAPGFSAYVPRGTVHTYQNFSQTTAHLLVMVTPAGLDRFFADVTVMSKGLSQPDHARLAQLMQDYGMELLGPPLA